MTVTFARRATTARSSAIRDLLEHASRPGMISLAGGLPDARGFPLAALRAAADRALRDPAHVQYGLTAGGQDVRRRLAATVRSGADDADRAERSCVVTTGSQQALDLLARVMVDEGDVVVVGEPDYLGLLQAVDTYGARLAPMPVDADGLDTDALEARIADGLRPKITYVVPHFHNPTGATLSAVRRRHLLDLAERHGFLVVEDDPYRDLWYDAPPSDPDSSDHLVVLRSASKVLAPGLRVGWMVGPEPVCEAVTIAKQAADLHTSTLTQAIVADCVGADWFADHLDGLRRDYAAKRDALVDALDGLEAAEARFSVPGGGMFCWLELPGSDTTALLAVALDEGVAFVPGAAFSSTGGLRSHARLSFATANPDELREGVTRLARALSRPWRGPSRARGGDRRGHAPSTPSAATLR